jgi:hypothetical protein
MDNIHDSRREMQTAMVKLRENKLKEQTQLQQVVREEKAKRANEKMQKCYVNMRRTEQEREHELL